MRIKWRFASILFVLIAVALSIKSAEGQDFDIHLNEINLSTDSGLTAPSTNGSFNLLATGIIDLTTSTVTILPQTSPVTQVSFGITTNFPFNPSQLRFDVGLDGYDNLVSLTNLVIQEDPFDFQGNPALPTYLVQGDLSQPFIPLAGQHALDIVDESNLPIGLGFVGERNSPSEFEADFIAAPEPASWMLAVAAMIVVAVLRRFGSRFLVQEAS
jgi:hypothetical protein